MLARRRYRVLEVSTEDPVEEEIMLRVTDDILEARHWAEENGGSPCRRPDGALVLCFGSDPSPALPIGWAEFEAQLVLSGSVLVYDDAPGSTGSFIGSPEEARAYVARAAPYMSGAAGPTP